MPTISRKVMRPGNRIRVLVVDDSVVIRRLVTHALEEDPDIEVVGVAADGSIALGRIPQVNPDVVTLDIEMPQMDGLETLRQIRKQYPSLRVIMFSTLTERGAAATFEALALGADDYVTKAANVGSLDRSMASLRGELTPKIKQFFELPGELTPAPPERAPLAVPPCKTKVRSFRRTARPKMLAIGVSTGGPTALSTIVPAFPKEFPLPILIVQHMPPVFTGLLADRLQATSQLLVEEASDGSPVQAGRILIARGDYHMRVHRSNGEPIVKLDQAPPENSCRPAVDVLFNSTEEVYGGDVIAVILTGMGYDGLRGARALNARGAYLIAQDEATSVVWGMPGAVAGADLADAILPLDGIVPEILRQVRRSTGG